MASEGSTSAQSEGEGHLPSRHSRPGDLFVLDEERGTVLYHGDDVISNVPNQDEKKDDEDDSFYEVTNNDVKSMYRDLQRKRDELENAPFRGQKLRALEKETATLKNLHEHPNTILRIRFPDRFVLQGIFRTSDTISSVKSWLREYLQNSGFSFYIFTAPPKKILNDDMKLVDEGLVAMVVLYFGSEEMPEDNRILNTDLYTKISSPDVAFDHAKNKLKVRKLEAQMDDNEVKPSTETQLRNHPEESSSVNPPQPIRRTTDKGKVPKWFKMK